MNMLKSVDNKLYEEYTKLKEEFNAYQYFAENLIRELNEKNTNLEKKLAAITNIVEISKYINSNVSEKNLIPMINDMIIGILGANYSTIFALEQNKLIVKATNLFTKDFDIYDNTEFANLLNGEAFIINSETLLFYKKYFDREIHSIIGVPIYLREKFMGYIVVKHQLYNYFSDYHIDFITTIANQIAIALENNNLYNQIRENSVRDPLLGVYNRRYFFEKVENKIKKDCNEEKAIIMVDLDDFKKINDLYGHQFGDEVLKQTSEILNETLDNNCIIARYGGEEIIIYLENIIINEVYKKINDIRLHISKNIINYGGFKSKITATFGISYYPEDGDKLSTLIHIADERLYLGKKLGKNIVVEE